MQIGKIKLGSPVIIIPYLTDLSAMWLNFYNPKFHNSFFFMIINAFIFISSKLEIQFTLF